MLGFLFKIPLTQVCPGDGGKLAASWTCAQVLATWFYIIWEKCSVYASSESIPRVVPGVIVSEANYWWDGSTFFIQPKSDVIAAACP